VFYTRHVEVMEKMRKSDQEAILWPWFKICDRVCIDSTGLGIGWADDAQDKFGAQRVEGVNFTGPVKEALAIRSRVPWKIARCAFQKTQRSARTCARFKKPPPLRGTFASC